MRCQICDSETENCEYNENTGKMDSICAQCGDSIGEVTMEYALVDEICGCDTEEDGW